ncbi:MAG TPA: 50S ribosomal protein L10 [Candidatus Wolfebacteria bacterium]|nr:50S ribosomal protein L10 [Candidatus Wolfebacteria bacterium]
MLTKKQKTEQIEEGQNLFKKSHSLVFIDFSGISVENINALRKVLREVGAKLKVVKKRLMRIIFEKHGIDFNPEQFESQLGTIFADKNISEIAGPVYKSKIKILGGYDLLAKDFMDAEKVEFIGKLPSKEVLLGQLVGMFAAPIKMFMRVLSEKSKMVEK